MKESKQAKAKKTNVTNKNKESDVKGTFKEMKQMLCVLSGKVDRNENS